MCEYQLPCVSPVLCGTLGRDSPRLLSDGHSVKVWRHIHDASDMPEAYEFCKQIGVLQTALSTAQTDAEERIAQLRQSEV